jgi:DNA-binding beta-propeller fold protein YncE
MLDPQTLQPTGSNTRIAATTQSSTGLHWTPVLAANANYSEIFLGNADQIYTLNPVTGAVEHQVGIIGLVGGLAVSPDGSKLYAGLNVQGSGTARLLVLDIRHGLLTLEDTALDNRPVAALLATSGGVWITYVTGRDNNIRFAPLTDLAHSRQAIPGGGGLPATATVAGGKVFLSGIYTIACADPMTGAVLAQAQQMGQQGLTHYFGNAQLVAGHYVAGFQTNYDDNRGLAILTPPAACR